jgi:hypothetical protein
LKTQSYKEERGWTTEIPGFSRVKPRGANLLKDTIGASGPCDRALELSCCDTQPLPLPASAPEWHASERLLEDRVVGEIDEAKLQKRLFFPFQKTHRILVAWCLRQVTPSYHFLKSAEDEFDRLELRIEVKATKQTCGSSNNYLVLTLVGLLKAQ